MAQHHLSHSVLHCITRTFFMAASITIAHGHANRDLPVRVPHLMPFHIQHTGPAPVSTYFRIRPHVDPSLPSSTLEDTLPSGNPEKELISTVSNSEFALEGKEGTPAVAADIAVPTTVTTEADVAAAKAQALAPTSRFLQTGAIARLSESAKRFVSSFRGRTVHGVEVALPKGYVGLVLRGDANGKTHQPASNAKRRRARVGQRRRKLKIVGGGDDDDDERCLDDAAEMSPEDGRPVSVLNPAARFDSFVLWHPDIAVDEGKDEYLRSLSEWVNIAAEVRPSESVRVGKLCPDGVLQNRSIKSNPFRHRCASTVGVLCVGIATFPFHFIRLFAFI